MTAGTKTAAVIVCDKTIESTGRPEGGKNGAHSKKGRAFPGNALPSCRRRLVFSRSFCFKQNAFQSEARRSARLDFFQLSGYNDRDGNNRFAFFFLRFRRGKHENGRIGFAEEKA